MINLYLGTINRSGGSLFCRLLDGHPDIAAYPLEVSFKNNPDIAPDLESITGLPRCIPKYDPEDKVDCLKLLDIPTQKIEPIYKWGKERSDPIGVRKNYLEKEFYGKVKTDFDYDKFINILLDLCGKARNFEDVWNARHIAYFQAWENGRYGGSGKYVVFHDRGGFYISNHGRFFDEFNPSFWIYPLRSVYGYIASEKTRLARRYYGSRRMPKIKMPNVLIKRFDRYDLQAHIWAWLAALTRVVLFQERYGVNDRFIVYRYENLLTNTEGVMKTICEKTGLTYNSCLLQPSIAGKPWGGSSHQGKQTGVNPRLAEYYPEVLRDEEISMIRHWCEPVIKFLEVSRSTPVDLTEIDRVHLYDYDFQKGYFEDEQKTALYSFIMNCRRRRDLIRPPGLSSLFAYVYSRVIRIIHIPRLLKLKYLPGIGRQNYT